MADERIEIEPANGGGLGPVVERRIGVRADVQRIGPGSPVNVSAIALSPHVGAHADAPLHDGPEAAAIGRLDLDPFIGHCRVIHAIDRGPLVAPG